MTDNKVRITITIEATPDTLAEALQTALGQIAVRELPKPAPRFEDVPAATSLRPTDPHLMHTFRRRRL